MKLILQNLSFSYQKNGKPIFTNFSYTFESGSTYLLKGNNGAGKTTLMNLIVGNLKPNTGYIEYPGGYHSVNITVKKMIGSCISNISNLVDDFTVEQYFTFLRKIYQFDKSTISDFTALFQIDYLEQSIKSLSSGMRKKVEIMGALLYNPEIILLDEPFTFLDVSAKEILTQMMIDYTSLKKKIIIFSSHEEKYEALKPIILNLDPINV